MFNKIYLRDSNLRPHLEAPFLQERERFVTHLADCGYCVRFLQEVSSYLLYAVQYLGLKDNDHTPVKVISVWKMGQAYHREKLANKRRKNYSPDVNTQYKKMLFYTISCLKDIGMLDELYFDSGIILNKIIVKDYYKLKHLSAPLLAERLSYLQHMQDVGYCLKGTIREAANMQLVIIEMLNLDTLRPVHVSEIKDACSKWNSINRGHHHANSPNSKRKFLTVAFKWLRYIGLLLEESKPIYEQNRITNYSLWLHQEKGFSEHTISRRKIELTHFTEYLNSVGKNIETISPAVIDGYIEQRGKEGCNRHSIAGITTILRDFLHYAFVCQWTPCDLSCSVHGPKLFSHEMLPYAPDWDVVKKLIAYYDGEDAFSIRNHAVLLLLAVYGLRSSEVAELKFGDIDWTNDTIVINHKKNGRSQLYPLFPEVGNAIVKYIREVRRNDWNDRHIFLTMAAPIRKLSSVGIYYIVARAYKGIGVSAKHYGGHTLRHACASKLINTGSSIKSVSDVLGHRSVESTRVYTRLDLSTLSLVANMNWEGLL